MAALGLFIITICYGVGFQTHYGPDDNRYAYRIIFDFQTIVILYIVLALLFAGTICMTVCCFAPAAEMNRNFYLGSSLLASLTGIGFGALAIIVAKIAEILPSTGIPLVVIIAVIGVLIELSSIYYVGSVGRLTAIDKVDKTQYSHVNDMVEALRELKSALNEGLITQEEYEKKRQEIIGE